MASNDKHQKPSRPWLPLKGQQRLLIVVILIFCGLQIFVSVDKYLNLLATSEDLGYIEQMLWMIAHGDLWAFTTVFQTPALGDTFSLAMYPLALIYRYVGGVYALFVIQAVSTGVTAWGLFQIARIKGLGERTSVVIAAMFLLYPGVLGGSQFDFHVDFIALPFFVWAYLFYQKRRIATYYTCLVAAILCKDIGGLIVAAWGIGLIVERKRGDGLGALALGVLMFGLEAGILMPIYFKGETLGLDMSLYAYLGKEPLGILLGVVTRLPLLFGQLIHRSIYIMRIFLPVAFLPLLGSSALLPTLVLFGFNYLSSQHAQQRVDNQFQVILSGWVYLALIEGITRVKEIYRPWWLASAAGLSLLQEGLMVGGVIIPLMTMHSGQLPFVRQAARTLPNNSVIYTQNRVGPQIAQHIVWGAEVNGIRSVAVDPLPLLWKEGYDDFGNHHTEILSLDPSPPYISELVGMALKHGFKVTFHAGRVYVVSGDVTFQVPPPGVGWGRQSSRLPQVFPAWTERVNQGVISWGHLWLESRVGESGWILGGPRLRLDPGQYEASFHFAPTFQHRSAGRVGKVVVVGTKAGMPVFQGEEVVRLPFVVGEKVNGHRRRVVPALWSNGRDALRLSYLRVSQR